MTRPSVQVTVADSQALAAEARANRDNGCVGHQLVLENARVRIWQAQLVPGQRLAFHSHRFDHLRIARTPCQLWSISAEGRGGPLTLAGGAVSFHRVPQGQRVLRSLLNIGDEAASFLVIELIETSVAPLPVPEHVRLR